MALFFEDFTVDKVFETPARTVTEADIVNFAALSWDTNPLHVDKEFAKNTQFKRPIAHGLCILSMFTGLQSKLGIIDGSAIALVSINFSFRAPVFAGDTIRAKITVTDKKESKSKPDRGLVTFMVEIINQENKVVQEGFITLLIKKKIT